MNMKSLRSVLRLRLMLMVMVILVSLILPTSPAQSASQTVSVQLNWVDNSNLPENQEDGFYVEQCVGVGCSSFTRIGNPVPQNQTAFTDSIANDPGGRTICYRVVAFNKSGVSTPSNIACTKTPTIIGIPSAPSGIIAVIIGVVVP